jgi:hypothetical protein
MGFQWIVLGNIIQCSFSCPFDESFSKQAKKKCLFWGCGEPNMGEKNKKL